MTNGSTDNLDQQQAFEVMSTVQCDCRHALGCSLGGQRITKTDPVAGPSRPERPLRSTLRPDVSAIPEEQHRRVQEDPQQIPTTPISQLVQGMDSMRQQQVNQASGSSNEREIADAQGAGRSTRTHAELISRMDAWEASLNESVGKLTRLLHDRNDEESSHDASMPRFPRPPLQLQSHYPRVPLPDLRFQSTRRDDPYTSRYSVSPSPDRQRGVGGITSPWRFDTPQNRVATRGEERRKELPDYDDISGSSRVHRSRGCLG